MNYESIEKKRKEYVNLLKKSLKIVKDRLKGKVEKIIVFGSYFERKDLFTDLDLLIIMETDKPFIERIKEIYSLLHLPVDADILCYTPSEIEKLKERNFFKKILKEGKILYEKRKNRRR
ncbi:MAG: nucleotidyltransferase domain-containing protein [candidate division WOR-3 bacterium]